MTFYVQGLNIHELMPQTQIFKGQGVAKTQAMAPSRAVVSKEYQDKKKQQKIASKAYQTTQSTPYTNDIVHAEQIMTSPIISMDPVASVNDALNIFKTKNIRHIPIISPDTFLVGIISERDILHHLGGITDDFEQYRQNKSTVSIEQIMKSPVLTASNDTDVRYIARLFIEQQIGALPIVNNGHIVGIITRSDVLKAVIRYYNLEIWV